MATQRFAILSVPRSGTNYFISKIGFLPGVLFAWEPFNRGMDSWFDATSLFNALPRSAQDSLTDRNMKARGYENFYEVNFSPRSEILLPDVSALGFKLFPNHSPHLFWKIAADREMKVIVIERKNRFHTFASYLMALRTQSFTTTEFDTKGLFLFDPAAFGMFVQLNDCIYEGLRFNLSLNGTRFIHLYYEDFATNEDEFARACEFVGIVYSKVDTPLKKQITVHPHDLFSNASVLEEHLSKYYPQFLE